MTISIRRSRGILVDRALARLTPAFAISSVLSGGLAVVGCGSPPKTPASRPLPQTVFDLVAPSVVAIMNDDSAERDRETKVVEAALGDETRAPKHVVDVSLRSGPQPEGTGFMVDGGRIVTAAHVVQHPDHLKVLTRGGQIEEADLVAIDEVRDIAILKPKKPLAGVPAIAVDDRPIRVGEPVWALGHTGEGYWQLSWGMSEGIASGVVDAFGAKLLLMDASIYPGFSGGPVVDIGDDGVPRVVGVNHASLFPFSSVPIYSLPSAVSAQEVRAVLDGKRPDIEPILADYAKKESGHSWADLFVTDSLDVGRDANGQQVASIEGDAHDFDVDEGEPTRIPVVAMLFGLTKGSHDFDVTALDPAGNVKATSTAHADIKDGQRVAFASSSVRFLPEASGRYFVVIKEGGMEIGRTAVTLDLDDDDDSLTETRDADAMDDGQPDVDIVVAESGTDDPLSMEGIRGSWAETSYPRRVDYSWFARGSRGWTGTNVSISAFVLDEQGQIIGRSEGCYHSELRPEMPWSCAGTGGAIPPLPMRQGHYDIVFAMNNRPVAWWPMEATLRPDSMPGSDVERWAVELTRAVKHREKARRDKLRAAVKEDKAAAGSKPSKPAPKKPSHGTNAAGF